MAKIIRAAKGTPQQLQMLAEQKLDELEMGDVAEAAQITSARGNRGQLYVDMDGSIVGQGETVGIFELRELYEDLHDDDPVVNDYDTFESWLRDTVNNGYLKPIRGSFVYPDDLEDLENGEYESHVTEPINCSLIVRPAGKSFGVYAPDGNNHAEILFRGTEDECYDWISKVENTSDRLGQAFSNDEIESATGSPQELQMLVESQIDKLETGVGASFVYPEDLIDLENGEYESHATEPVNSSFVYPEDLEAMENGEYESHVTEPINAAVEFTEIELEEPEIDLLNEIADRYVSSEPLSGDWDTETEHEQQAIADELGCTLDEARYLMKKYLGFTDDMFACNTIESAEGVPGIDYDDEFTDETFRDRYMPDVDAIVDWLWEHKQAYEDACRYFQVRRIDTSDPSTGEAWQEWDDLASYADADQLIDWIADHDQLADDFSNEFGPEWIEGACNTTNISAGTVDDKVARIGDYIRKVDEIIYPNLSDRYTCLNDVQAQYSPSKEIGDFDNGTFRITISFVDDINESDIHIAYSFKDLPDDPSEAAYFIQNEIEDDWGDELDQLEANYSSADWMV